MTTSTITQQKRDNVKMRKILTKTMITRTCSSATSKEKTLPKHFSFEIFILVFLNRLQITWGMLINLKSRPKYILRGESWYSFLITISYFKVVIAFSNWWYSCREPNIQIWYLDKVLVSNEFLWLFIYSCI